MGEVSFDILSCGLKVQERRAKHVLSRRHVLNVPVLRHGGLVEQRFMARIVFTRCKKTRLKVEM